ncbi:TetR/AcrR family transcriptional regulator [Psychrobacillus sp. OK032]|uniref:TetR/AcrR family transcriptional regulator n=1 Tax=Psychrobacillus sp. OK032 TaxID=1884358 RepID=UPI0008CBBF95|nr:TetR/AcrR family transcriptional regulator [Psychrobacillus sp. OK032]SER67953.1 transcriptional regulator, TetR family [Psychrobacillus sp. OK032]
MKLSERKLQKKKHEIILSAVKIVNQKGYQGATMEEIAAELLMTKGSLYYYFKNKEDLIFQCHEMVLGQAINKLQDYINEDISNEQKLRKMIASHIRYAIEEKETFNMIIKPDETFSKDQLSPILNKRNEYASWFDQVIQKGIAEGDFRIKEPKIARMILLGSMNWIQQWYKVNGDKTIEDIQAIYADYLIKVVK